MAEASNIRPFTHELVKLPSGTSLEASLAVPPGEREHTRLAVCLHPWSWLGGCMDDPVLLSAEEMLLERGYCVLRYNSRGVGRSQGRASFTGNAEARDLGEVVGWGMEAVRGVGEVVILGYSYGALIASRQPVLPAPVKTRHVLLSYPLGPRAWLTLFSGRTYEAALRGLVGSPGAQVRVAYGTQDDFTAEGKYEVWAEGLRKEAEGAGGLEIVRVEGATHFWRGGGQLREALGDIGRSARA